MNRTRISTTVDDERPRTARRLGGVSDAELLDRALAVFIETVEGERERAALPYDGEIPVDVLRLAEERRRSR